MSWIKGLGSRLRATVRGDESESRIAEEFRFHLEMEIRKNVEAGMSREEARCKALAAFGDVKRLHDVMRPGRAAFLAAEIVTDVRRAVRRLRMRPAFAITILATLAVGLGAVAAAYGVAYGVLFRPLLFPESDRLVKVWQTIPGWERFPSSWPIYDHWAGEATSFAGLAAYGNAELVVTGGLQPERLAGSPATANLDDVLGVAPLYGRWFTEEESVRGDAVAVVSHDFWRARLGGTPAALGSELELDEGTVTVIGIMPAEFRFPSSATAVWMPIGPDDRARGWNSQFLAVIGRLAPGRTVDATRAEVAAVTARAVASGDSPDVGSRVVGYRDDAVQGIRRSLLLTLGAAAAALLIAFLNVANLFLARGTRARREVALQQALGAKKLRVARELMIEGVVLGVVGAAAGLLFAQAALASLDTLLPFAMPRVSEIVVDAPVVLVVLAVASVLGAALGFISAASAFRLRASAAIGTSAGHATAGRGARRFRAAMVAAQVAGVFCLLSGAGLMLESLSRLVDGDRGFEESGLAVLVEPEVLEERFPQDATRNEVFRQLVERFAAMPAVQGAALVAPLPFGGSERNSGVVLREGEDPTRVGVTEVTAGALEVLGVRVLEGRAFAPSDEGPASTVAIVGESLARMIRTEGSAVGSILPMGDGLRIVGVVADVRQDGLDDQVAPPRVWVPWSGIPGDDVSVVARTDGDPGRLLPELRAALVQVEPMLVAERLTTVADLVHETAALPRFRALLLTVLAVAAGLIAAVGIYGVTSYAVVERRRELAIRCALGARATRVAGDAVGREVRTVAVGLVVGLSAALLLGRTLRGFLHEVGPADPTVHGLTALAILAVSAAAAAVPALRAIRTDPAEALKQE